jgi:hypothetical protein
VDKVAVAVAVEIPVLAATLLSTLGLVALAAAELLRPYAVLAKLLVAVAVALGFTHIPVAQSEESEEAVVVVMGVQILARRQLRERQTRAAGVVVLGVPAPQGQMFWAAQGSWFLDGGSNNGALCTTWRKQRSAQHHRCQ